MDKIHLVGNLVGVPRNQPRVAKRSVPLYSHVTRDPLIMSESDRLGIGVMDWH